MASTCFSPIKASAARIIRVDVCGVPVTGAGNQVVVDGFTSITPSPEYEEGEEFLTKKANGEPCVNQKDPNFLKRVGLDVEFCNIDVDAIVLLTGERLMSSGATGTGVFFGEGLLTARFALEVWQPIAGAGACTAGGAQNYVYWVFPNVGNAMVGDWTLENSPTSFTVSGDTRAAAAQWGQGPGPTDFASAPKYLPESVATDEHFGFNVTTVPPPTVACGAIEL